jgi:hypothetical protein
MTQQIEQAGIHAARRGSGLHKYVNDKTASGSSQVLTDATLFEDVPEGYQIVVAMMHLDLETLSDDVSFEVVSTSAVSGGGTPTTLCGHAHLFVGASAMPSASKDRRFIPPMVIKYSSGARSVTMRINANDSSAVVSCGWMGWIEPET